jgi:hypothetical protein
VNTLKGYDVYPLSKAGSSNSSTNLSLTLKSVPVTTSCCANRLMQIHTQKCYTESCAHGCGKFDVRHCPFIVMRSHICLECKYEQFKILFMYLSTSHILLTLPSIGFFLQSIIFVSIHHCDTYCKLSFLSL